MEVNRGSIGRNSTDHILGAILELFWSHFGAILELFGVHFGAILGQFWIIWGQLEVTGDNLGAMLVSVDRLGAMLVSLDHVYTLFVSFLMYFLYNFINFSLLLNIFLAFGKGIFATNFAIVL